MSGRRAMAVVALAVVALTGCGGESVPEVPDDAIRLVVNQPARVDGLVVTAYQLRDDSASVLVRDGEESETAVVAVGDEGEALGLAFRLVAVKIVPSQDDVPGGDRSAVWIVPVAG